jgi:hypothetical protein
MLEVLRLIYTVWFRIKPAGLLNNIFLFIKNEPA